MGAAALHRRRRRRLPGLLGREARRQAGRDRTGARSPQEWVGRRAGGVELTSGVESAGGVESAVCGEVPGALTLDDLIAGAWEELGVCEVVRCPVCGGTMASCGGGTASGAGAPDGAALDGVSHGDCVDCGTQLR
jgi:hypothetical protein